jgi:hypothetical protein
MDPSDRLQIDLADKDDIRVRLPEVKRLYEGKRRELESLRAEVDYWGELADLLARIVGESPVTARGGSSARESSRRVAAGSRRGRKAAPAQQRAIAALERANRPIGPAALYRFMLDQNMDVPSNPNSLGAALWTAHKAGRIRKTPDDLYAPLGWEPTQAELNPDPSHNGTAVPEVEDQPSSTREAV